MLQSCALIRFKPAFGWLRLTLALTALLVSCGCSGAKLEARQPIGIKLQPNYTDFVMSVQSQVMEDVSEEIVDIYKEVLDRLKKRTQFQRYGTAKQMDFSAGQRTPQRTIVAQVVIKDIRKVSTGANVMFGMMAGTAHLDTDLTLTDGATGQDIGKYRITSSAGTTNAVVASSSKKIATTIIDAYR